MKRLSKQTLLLLSQYHKQILRVYLRIHFHTNSEINNFVKIMKNFKLLLVQKYLLQMFIFL